MNPEPLPPGVLLGAAFRTWARILPWIAVALGVCCAPAIWWLQTRGFGWPVVGLGLVGEAIAWTLVTPRALDQPGLGFRAVPRAVACLALAYAPIPPLIVDRGEGLTEAARLTREHRSALHGALMVVGAIWFGVVLVMLTITMEHGTLKAWRGVTHALVYAWLVVSTLRGAMAAGVYVAIRAWWNPADLSKVFE